MALRKLPNLTCLVVVASLALSCRESATMLTGLDDARSLAADLRVHFNKAADASNRAVMADTDEASIAFAKESEQATRVVEKDMTAIAPLLRALRFTEETRIYEEFSARFSASRELDRSILALAVENTNLKAQHLSFGPAMQLADKFKASLAALPASFPPKDQSRAEALVAQSVTAVREIQVLHAPHIAEQDDSAMTKMEQEMARLDSSARTTLKALDELAPPNTRPSLDAARATLDEFKATTAKIVELSRRNTNVRSLDLSLRRKPAVAAACDERLSALQQALAKEGSKATR